MKKLLTIVLLFVGCKDETRLPIDTIRQTEIDSTSIYLDSALYYHRKYKETMASALAQYQEGIALPMSIKYISAKKRSVKRAKEIEKQGWVYWTEYTKWKDKSIKQQ